MTASDQLAKLSARAKQAEDHAAASHDKAKAQLEQDVSAARASAQEQAEKLRETADGGERKISDRWSEVQRTWHDHVAALRDDVQATRAELDLEKAERRAENAADDALFAIDFAYSAIEEAEYAVLDAQLAQMDADELSTGQGASA